MDVGERKELGEESLQLTVNGRQLGKRKGPPSRERGVSADGRGGMRLREDQGFGGEFGEVGGTDSGSSLGS